MVNLFGVRKHQTTLGSFLFSPHIVWMYQSWLHSFWKLCTTQYDVWFICKAASLPSRSVTLSSPPNYLVILCWSGRAENTKWLTPLGFIIIWAAGLPCHRCPSARAHSALSPLPSHWNKVHHCAVTVQHMISLRISIVHSHKCGCRHFKNDASPSFLILQCCK